MKRNCFFLIIVLLSQTAFSQYQTGTLGLFESGDGIYRDGAAGHGHTGVIYGLNFNGTTYFMGLYETGGYEKIGHGGDRDTKSSSFNIDFYNISFINSFNDLKTTFKRGEEYKGVFTNPATTPSQRNSIVSNASSLYYHDPGYTLIDMIDPFGIPGWVTWLGGEDWKGKISDIDEIQCEGYVEYSYEKSGVIVLGANIGSSGNNNVNKHNFIHNGVAFGAQVKDPWDINDIPYCPKIQANLAHEVYYGVSTFAPSVVLPPNINNPVITSVTLPKYTWNWIEGYQEDYTGECDPPQQYDCTYQNWVTGYWEPTQTGTINGLQIGVTVSDNGSVSSYLLVQAKLPTESQWHVIRDISAPDNCDWQFKAIPLTSWNGTVQTGVVNIGWAGETSDSRLYSFSEMKKCLIKITAVDQGGNVASVQFDPGPIIVIEKNQKKNLKKGLQLQFKTQFLPSIQTHLIPIPALRFMPGKNPNLPSRFMI